MEEQQELWFVFLWEEWGDAETGQRVPCTLESLLHLPVSGPLCLFLAAPAGWEASADRGEGLGLLSLSFPWKT